MLQIDTHAARNENGLWVFPGEKFWKAMEDIHIPKNQGLYPKEKFWKAME